MRKQRKIIRNKISSIKRNISEELVNEDQLRTFMNAIPDFVCFKNAEGRILEANTFAIQFLGLENIAYKGKNGDELAEVCPYFSQLFIECNDLGQQGWIKGEIIRTEKVVTKPDGELLVLDVIQVPVFHPDGTRKGLVVIGRDVTERYKAQKELYRLNQQNQHILNAAGEGILGFDQHGNCIFINPAASKMLGVEQHDLMKNQLQTFFHQAISGRDTYHVEDCTPPYNGVMHRVLEDYFCTKDGSYFPVEYIISPILEKERIVGSVITFKDMSDRIKNEEMLRRSDRLSVLGQMAAGISHELKNPLTVIRGFLQMMQSKYVEEKKYFDLMLSEVDRMTQITSELMLLAKPEVVHIQPASIPEIVEDIITFVRPQSNLKGIEITFQSEVNLSLVNCEKNQIKQVILNILKNAIEAQEKGIIQVQVRELNDGEILIRCIDQGSGIEKEKLSSLGEPFYTTKKNGTGLGFMICLKIIENHSGRIEVSSEKNVGTTVDVILPVKNNKNIAYQNG